MPKLLDKRSAILDTAMELIGEQGFHNTPMSQIAKQAGVSAGIIYHYFESKDDLIKELYREIKVKMTDAIFRDAPAGLSTVETMRHLWLNAYKFYVAHPKETVFLEQYENSPFYKHLPEDFNEEAEAFTRQIYQEIAEGKLIDLPIMVLYSMTIGVALSLAKQHIQGLFEPDETMLERIVDAICCAVQP